LRSYYTVSVSALPASHIIKMGNHYRSEEDRDGRSRWSLPWPCVPGRLCRRHSRVAGAINHPPGVFVARGKNPGL